MRLSLDGRIGATVGEEPLQQHGPWILQDGPEFVLGLATGLPAVSALFQQKTLKMPRLLLSIPNLTVGGAGFQACLLEWSCRMNLTNTGGSEIPFHILSPEDIAHYHRIVVALSETIRIMKEIDLAIESHGGWPGAFQAGRAD